MKKATLPKATQDRLAAIHVNYFQALLFIRNDAERQLQLLFGLTEEERDGTLNLYPKSAYRTPGKSGHSAFQSEDLHYLYFHQSEDLLINSENLIRLREAHNSIAATLFEVESEEVGSK